MKVAKIFDCPFCNDTKVVEVKFHKDKGIAEIRCRMCHASFQTRYHRLTEAIDVYCDWIDAAEQENVEVKETNKEVEDILDDSDSPIPAGKKLEKMEAKEAKEESKEN